jgi:hypothetical protein
MWIMNNPPQPEDDLAEIRKLYPGNDNVWLKEAKTNLEAYAQLLVRIAERISEQKKEEGK